MAAIIEELYINASAANDVKLMKNIFFKNKTVVVKQNDTAWHAAVINGAVNSLEYLWQHKKHWWSNKRLPISPNNITICADDKDWFLYFITLAIKQNNFIVNYLIRYFCIKIDDLFLLAANSGNITILQYCYKINKNCISAINELGNNALHLSIISSANEDISIMKLLINMGVNLCHFNKDGNNIIILAAKHGKLALIKWIYNNYSNATACKLSNNTLGENIFLTAARYDHCFILQFLIKTGFCGSYSLNNECKNAYIIAEEAGRYNVLRLLRNYSQVIPKYAATYKTRDSVILYAAFHGHTSILRELYNNGYNMKFATSNLDNAIIIAANSGWLDSVKYLESINIPYCKNIYGHDAYMSACYSGHLDVVKYLHPNPIFTDVISNTGMTGFLKAIEGEHLHIIKWLSDKTDIYCRNHEGRTAMQLAIAQNCTSIIEYLSKFDYDFQENIDYAKSIYKLAAIALLYKNKYCITSEINECIICYCQEAEGDNYDEFITCNHNHTFHLSCQIKTGKNICVYCTIPTFKEL